MQSTCLNCGREAGQQCKRCKRAYYCSAECKHADWDTAHSVECAEGSDINADVDNQWTGIFRQHTQLYIDWINSVNVNCDPMAESALEARGLIAQQLSQLADQSDRRFSTPVVESYLEALTKFGTSTILRDEAANSFQRTLVGGQIADVARVFGIVQRQKNMTKEDYESAWQAHVEGLINYTEAVKNNLDPEELVEKRIAATTASIRAGQTFWGRKWRPLSQ